MRRALSRMFCIVAAVAILLLVLPMRISAQRTFENTPEPGSSADRYGDMSHIGENPFENPEDEEAVDSTAVKPPKIRKPLESYFFDDSTRVQHNFAWQVDMMRNRIKKAQIDTSLNNLELDFPFQRNGVGDSYQGALGGASVPFNYADRPHFADFSFADGFYSYYVLPETAKYYNVKKPFTQFSYYMAGQKSQAEENFGITHAQNISPSTGFNVDYKSRGTKGQYNWQNLRDKNLSVAMSHTGKQYTVHAGYIYNAVINQENGGITDDRLVTDTVVDLTSALPTNLKDAVNKIKNNTFYMVHSYGIPLRRLSDDDFSIADRSSVFVGLSTEYNRWGKKYTDTREGSRHRDDNNQVVDFYENWYIDPDATYDSIFETRFANRAFVQIQPWDRDGIIGTIDAGAGVDVNHYYQYDPSQVITGGRGGENETKYYVYGSVDGKINRYFDWGGNIMFHPAGAYQGDLKAGAQASFHAYIKDEPITLSGEFSLDRRSPDYWSQRLFSNHYVWSNSFVRENETRFKVKLDIPAIALEAGATQSVIGKKIYYGADATPVQHSGNVSVTGVYVSKDFRVKVGKARQNGFHFNHRVLLQWSTSQEVVPVPLAAAFASYYFEFEILPKNPGILRCQFGIDARYNTEYYAQGWNPATAKFYNQREKEVGDYIKADVFLNAKWKRMRIFVKMEHANEDLIGPRRYFSVPHYPLGRRVMKYGISWSFYD